MKKKLLELSNAVLSKDQMKEVKGGENYWETEMGSCTKSCTVGSITTTCTSTSGSCSSSAAHETQQWIKCDGTKYNC